MSRIGHNGIVSPMGTGRSVYHKDLHRSKNAEKGTHYIPGDPGEGTVPARIMMPVVLIFLKTR